MDLHPDHLTDLQHSGLSDKTIVACGFKSVRPSAIKNLPGVTSACEYPYYTIDGRTNGFVRQKLFPALIGKDGHKQKYSQGKGSTSHLYMPPLHDWTTIAQDTGVDIVIVEGEKKAAKASQEGLHAMGISGNFRNPHARFARRAPADGSATTILLPVTSAMLCS